MENGDESGHRSGLYTVSVFMPDRAGCSQDVEGVETMIDQCLNCGSEDFVIDSIAILI